MLNFSKRTNRSFVEFLVLFVIITNLMAGVIANGAQRRSEEVSALNSHIDITAVITRL